MNKRQLNLDSRDYPLELFALCGRYLHIYGARHDSSTRDSYDYFVHLIEFTLALGLPVYKDSKILSHIEYYQNRFPESCPLIEFAIEESTGKVVGVIY